MKFSKSKLATVVAGMTATLSFNLAAQGVLEEILVTATKTAESQQSVPLAVTAFNPEMMANRGITETSEMTGIVPSLVVSSPFGRTQPNFALRGISVANEFNPNAASPIGVYVNEDYKQFRPTHGMQLFDLDRVEVIRGPQGTLFGRNTTGGAISFHTKKPNFGEVGEFAGFIKGKYGNYNRWGIEAAVETTLVEDTLAVRFAITENQGDGYIENITPATVQSLPELLLGAPGSKPVNALTQEDYASIDDSAVRATVVWTPTESFEATFIATMGDSSPIGAASISNEFGPQDANGNHTNIFGYNREQFGAVNNDQGVADQTGEYKSNADDYSLTLDWSLSEEITLTSITGYLEGELGVPRDCDGLPLPMCFVDFNSDFDQLNQDFRFTWVGEKATFIAGIYYGEDEVRTVNDETFFEPFSDLSGIPAANFQALAAVAPLAQLIYNEMVAFNVASFPFFNPPVDSYFQLGQFVGAGTLATGFRALSQFNQNRESQAIYAEGTYDFSDALSITLGLRYTEDDFTLSQLRSTFFDLATNTAQYNAIPLNPVADLNQVMADLTGNSEEVTGRAIINYRFNDDMMSYASYSRGYRAGTFNGKASQSVTQVTFVEPEFVDNYEVGFKSRLMDNKLQLNIAAFLADYKDQQIQEVVGATSFLRNASGEMRGLEVELETYLTDKLFVGLSYGFLDSEYDANQIVNSVDIGGNQFPFAPEQTASIYTNWALMDIGAGKLEWSAVVRYSDKVWFDPFNDIKTSLNGPGESGQYQDAYTIIDSRLAYVSDTFELALWGKNLADKFYYVSGFDTSAFLSDDLVRGEPRTYGVEARYNF